MKRGIKKAICVICMAVMIVSMSACEFNVSTTNNLSKTALEYNTEYMADEFGMDTATCEVIASKLDETGFGKIKSNKRVIVNGNGSITFGDGKTKYVINVEDGYISNITTKDGMVVMTLEDILNASATNADAPVTETQQATDTTNQVETQTETQTQDLTQTTTDNDTQTFSDTQSNDTTTVSEEQTTTAEASASTGTGSAMSSYLSDQSQSIMNSLDTDYNKVRWGVQYSPTGMDGIVISVAPYYDGKYPYLLVAVTNIYDSDVTFSAKGYAKGQNGEKVGDVSFYELGVRPGNTIVRTVYCSDVPTGEIHWDSIELPKNFDDSAYWESDWALSKDSDGYYQVDYNILSEDNMMPGYVTAILLDSKGYIVAVAQDYNMDKGTSVSGTVQYFKKQFDGTPVDIAMFANPLKTK